MRYSAYTAMIQEITFLEFLEVILSFMPYILLEIFLVFVGWTIIGWFQSHKFCNYDESFHDRYVRTDRRI